MISHSQMIQLARQAGSRYSIDRGQRRLIGAYRIPPQFDLGEYLDDAAEQNDPKQTDAGLSAGFRGRN